MTTFGIDPDERVEVPAGVRRTGIFGGKGIFSKYFNQLIFETKQDHIWGTQAQTLTDDATFYTDSSGNPFDKNDVAVTLANDDKILATHNATLAANLKLDPVSSVRLQIEMLKGVDIDFGDAGSGVPFKMILGGNIAKGSRAKIRGTFDFRESTIARADKRLISGQTRDVKIDYNGFVVADPNHVGEIFDVDTELVNPYPVEYNGQTLDWKLAAADANINDHWYRDLNIFGSGLIFDGTSFVETNSRFTLPAVIGANPHLFQVNTSFGFLRHLTDDDPDIHTRTDRNGVSVATNAAFVNTTNIVTFTSISNLKNGMRISGADAQGIPDATSGTKGTTILINIDTTALTAEMVDGLTGVVVNATSTVGSIATIMDNSGAAGGSEQSDFMQQITGEVLDSTNSLFWDNDINISHSGALQPKGVSGPRASSGATGSSERGLVYDNSASISPNTAKTSEFQTNPQSTGVKKYQRP